jgi:hypothetical protein
MSTILFWTIGPRPPSFGIFRLTALGLALSALPCSSESVRTAQWYAQNHEARFEMVERCNNNPGQARRSDDCAAAWQGNIIAAEEEARRNLHDNTPPTSPRYWQRRPLERREILTRCAGLPEREQAASMLCTMARRT